MYLLRRKIAVRGSPIAESVNSSSYHAKSSGRVILSLVGKQNGTGYALGDMAPNPSETRTIQGRHYPSTILQGPAIIRIQLHGCTLLHVQPISTTTAANDVTETCKIFYISLKNGIE
jgi:hypothetical protein